jgi:hypothetical protein
MQMAVTPQMAIAHFKAQIDQLERKQHALNEARQSLTAAIGHFSAFIKSPSITTVGLLAEGLRSMAAAQLHGFELESKFVHDALESLKAQLKQTESPIHTGTLIPPNGPLGKR